MRTALKKLFAPALLMLTVLAMSFSVQAAITAPTITSIKAAESKVTIKYTPISGADGYALYLVNPTTGEKLRETPLNAGKFGDLKNKTSVTVSGLPNGKTYGFRMAAVSGSEFSSLSNKMTAKPTVKNPGAMVNARVSGNGNKSVTLSWTKLSSASGYIIYQKTSTGYKELKRVTKGSTTSVTIKGLTNNKTYYFKIAAYRTVDGITVKGSRSAALKGKPSNQATLASKVHTYYYKVKVLADVTATAVKGTGTLALKAGTTITVTKRVSGYTGTSYFTKDGVQYKVPSTYLNYDTYSFVTRTKTPYKDATAVAYVNYKGYKSNTDYMIWISTYTQQLYIFTGSQYNWKLFARMQCSTGMAGTYQAVNNPEVLKRAETPLGTSTIYGKQYSWEFAWDQHAYWASRIKGGAIHSELYYPDMTTWNLGVLGKPASHGCVRVYIDNAKYIYDNIPLGTFVVVY